MKLIDLALLRHLSCSGGILVGDVPAMAEGRSETIAARLGIPKAKVKQALDGLVKIGLASLAVGKGGHTSGSHGLSV